MPTYALSTTIKNGLNAVLKAAGLEIGTTLKQRIEDGRLRKLQEKDHWGEPRYIQGLQIDETKCLEFLSQTCAPFKSEYEKFPQHAQPNTAEFYLQNDWFGPVDAELLYSMVRSSRPRKIVEVGSGFSTRLIRMAIGHEKLQTRLTSIDPEPRIDIEKHADECIRKPVEDLDAPTIADSLDANDILFIDSSHLVRTGGDIPFLFLEVLPRLKQGVYVHIHDIFIPFDYPEGWVQEGRDWTEQYLVQSFLAYNSVFEIIWPAAYMWKARREDLQKIIGTTGDCSAPSSLWLRRVQ
jgi:predicted O-methyltransferase YrrM